MAGEGWVGIGARKWICIWKERLAGKDGAGQIHVFLRNFFSYFYFLWLFLIVVGAYGHGGLTHEAGEG